MLHFREKTEVHTPLQRSISRIVTPGPAIAGCQKVGHSSIEVIQADDFNKTDPGERQQDPWRQPNTLAGSRISQQSTTRLRVSALGSSWVGSRSSLG
jgi:hypothetical protein